MMTNEQIREFDCIVNYSIATEDELNLAFYMTDKGWDYTLSQVVYIRTGYKSFDDWHKSEIDNL